MQGSGGIATYIHAGKIGVMVEVICQSDLIAQSDVLQAFIRDIAMQIAAGDPRFIRKPNVPPQIVEHEREKYALRLLKLGNQLQWSKRSWRAK